MLLDVYPTHPYGVGAPRALRWSFGGASWVQTTHGRRTVLHTVQVDLIQSYNRERAESFVEDYAKKRADPRQRNSPC